MANTITTLTSTAPALGTHLAQATRKAARKGVPLTPPERWYAMERDRLALVKQAFVDAYGLKEFKPRLPNYRKLLMQGGYCYGHVKGVLIDSFDLRPASHYLNRPYGSGNPFDHVEIWGRDGVPLFLLGNPYGVAIPPDEPRIGDDAAETLKALRGLDLSVRVLHRSLSMYGFGTAQIAVYHWPTVEAVCGPCPFFPPYDPSLPTPTS